MSKGVLDLLTEEELASFGRRIIEEAIDARGFGVITKGEIEALMFDAIAQCAALKHSSNYALAGVLRIPERKVKSLQLAADLRFIRLDHTTAVREAVESMFNVGDITSIDERVQVAIENPAVLRQVEHAFKRTGHTPEYGRNREILVVTPAALLSVICAYLSESKAEVEYVEWLRGQIDNEKALAELKRKATPIKDRIRNALAGVGPVLLKTALREGARLVAGAR